jgi:hypothetical protein
MIALVVVLVILVLGLGGAIGVVLGTGFLGAGISADAVFAGVGALVGAMVTVGGALVVFWLRWRREDERAADDRRRRLAGARAIMSADLSTIIDYVEESSAAIRLAAAVVECDGSKEHVECPRLDTDILLRMADLVGLQDRSDNADQIVDLLQIFQVHHARMSGGIDDLNNPERRRPGLIMSARSFDICIDTVVEFFLRANRMFGYARREKGEIAPPPFDEDEINSAIRSLNIRRNWPVFKREQLIHGLTTMPPTGRWEREGT